MRRNFAVSRVLAACVLLLSLGVAPASADELTLASLKQNLDFVWMLIAAALVLMMQAGFLLLEAGMVRSKNSINVAQKNLLDMAFAGAAFALIGFMISFGPSAASWLPVGFASNFAFLSDLTPWQTGFFVFQVMFCATAATIVSGAVAERMRLPAYIIATVFLSLIVYPVFVHWAWGNALFDNSTAFLARAGFVDFAGSTVVHATGGWISLAACLVLGARLGRFDGAGRPVRITGHSPVLTTCGALILFVGWIGFNGGSTVAATPATAHIIANTVLAACTGGCIGFFMAWWSDGVIFPEKPVSGMLGGLVAVTAGCMVLDAEGALLVGLIGGAIAVWGNDFVERRLRLDDAVGAIGVHAFAGVAGTLALAFLAPVDNLPLGGRLDQFLVQAEGVAVNFAWSFGLGYLFFLALGRFVSLRVTRQEEEIGLNETEHGTRLGVGHVEQALGALVAGNADLTMRLSTAPGDESETLTALFNRLMDNIEAEESARRDAAERVRDAEEEERLSAIANATFEAIWILRDGRIIDGNRRIEDLFGAPLSHLKGQFVLDLVAPEYRQSVMQAMRLAVVDPYEVEILSAAGERVPVQMRGREIAYRGGVARVGCLVDLRERKAAERRIRHLALHDPLTGLPNRALFNERLEMMASRADSVVAPGAVLLIDLDRFKDINDVHGHPAGDAVIRAAAERLSALVGPQDTVARLGGDEFAIIAPGLAFANQAGDLAFRIVTQLGLPIDIGGGTLVRSGASVGVALCPRDGNTSDKLVSRADTALYNAKNRGRNTFCMFEPGMDQENEKRRLLEADLVDAIEREEFELHFQPRVNVDRCAVLSYEALIRWRHPGRGLVSPADFIPIAEQTGKIIQIGEWVLRTACRMAIEKLGEARVSVNVSPIQFRQKNFVEMVESVLAETGIDPGRLELEITEGVLIDDDRRATRILGQLKALGVTIALDDFGTGYSSLSYLSRFPFDTIKIDRSFVRELTKSENARAIVRTIIGLGSGLKMNVVAEGVEVVDEARMLAGIGCRELQGFLLGRPVPVEELAEIDEEAVARIISGESEAMVEALTSKAQELRGTAEEVEPARRVG